MAWTKQESGGTGGGSYTLPIASSTVLGGVKVGNGLSVNASTGSLNVVPASTSNQIIDVALNSSTSHIPCEGPTNADGFKLYPRGGTKIVIYFNNTAPRIFPFETKVSIPNNYSLYINITTGELVIDTFNKAIYNLIELVRCEEWWVTGGVLAKYLLPYGNLNYRLIMPKDYDFVEFTGATSSITFVQDKLWIFEQTTDDVHTAFANLKIKSLTDINNNIKTIPHNLGHMNTADYNAKNDCMIAGNGSKSYTLPSAFCIFPNASNWQNLTTIDWNVIDKVEYDMSIDFPTSVKCQAVWGEPNGTKNNIIYLVMNDNKFFVKLLLGQGTNNLGKGTFIDGKTGTQFNGTYKILGQWYLLAGGGVNQDCFYYNGAIYSATNGNGTNEVLGVLAYKYELHLNGLVNRKAIFIDFWDDAGKAIESAGEGIDIYNGKIYLAAATSDAKAKLFSFDIV